MNPRIPHHNLVMPQLYLRMKYPLRFFVCYFHPVTQQYESKSTSVIKVAAMKNTDNFSLHKGSHLIQPPN